MEARTATIEELQTVHSTEYVAQMKETSKMGRRARRKLEQEIDNDIYLTSGSSESALLAAGSVIEVRIQGCGTCLTFILYKTLQIFYFICHQHRFLLWFNHIELMPARHNLSYLRFKLARPKRVSHDLNQCLNESLAEMLR